MSTTILTTVALLLGQALGDDPSVESTVRRLVRQLDGPRLAERETAERELLEMGPKVLDLLPTPQDRLSAEVQQRVGRIRHMLTQQLAVAAAEPSRVKLEGTLPLTEILTGIQEQTGNRIVLRDAGGLGGERKLTVDFDGVSFWQALDELTQQAGLSVYPYGEDKAIALVARGEGSQARESLVSYSGPFRFEAIRVLAQRDLRAADGGSLRLTVEATWEPRLSPISLQQPMNTVEALDEKGNPIAVDQQKAAIEVPVSPLATAVEIVLPFELPSREVNKIARLSGNLRALVPGNIETFRFDDLTEAKNVEKRVAGVTVRLEQVRKNNAVWEVRIRVRYDEPAGSMASHRTWMFDNEAYLEGPQEKKLEYDAFETTWQSENEFGIAYLFGLQEPLDDYFFVYKTPSRILASDFHYAIEGVELP